MKYFWYNGTLYTAINPSDVDSLPGIPNSDPVYNLKGRELRHAIWVTERCPELAYMVRSYDSESAFLSRLQVDPAMSPFSDRATIIFCRKTSALAGRDSRIPSAQ